MAHKKAGGLTSLGRVSKGQRLGTKKYGDEVVKPGMIIVRERGTKSHPCLNVRRGRDDTLYSLTEGKVYFSKKKTPNFTGKLRWKKFVSVMPKK